MGRCLFGPGRWNQDSCWAAALRVPVSSEPGLGGAGTEVAGGGDNDRPLSMRRAAKT